jgi:hypothetical protein
VYITHGDVMTRLLSYDEIMLLTKIGNNAVLWFLLERGNMFEGLARKCATIYVRRELFSLCKIDYILRLYWSKQGRTNGIVKCIDFKTYAQLNS